jgi:hypothetical protein
MGSSTEKLLANGQCMPAVVLKVYLTANFAVIMGFGDHGLYP